MLQNNEPEDIEIPSTLKNIKRPWAYNKKKDENKERGKPRYNEPVNIQEADEEPEHVQEPDRQPEQHQELEEYEAPQAVQQENIPGENVQPPPEPQFELIQTAIRRSKRIPKLSAKALCQFEHDQWYDKENE